MAKIMLVEDDNNLSEIYQARMMAEGYTVVAAHDGEEALALAAKEKPDLIISDVMMPKISGFEMLDILRNTQGLKDTKVIMLTALGQAEDKTRADTLGANRYLVKSQVTLEDIVKAAQELLAGADANNTAAATPAAPAVASTPVTPTPVATPPSTPAPAAPQPLAVAPAPQAQPAISTPLPNPSATVPVQAPSVQSTPAPTTPAAPAVASTPVTPTPVATPPSTPAPQIAQPVEPQGATTQSTAQEQTAIQSQIANFEQQPQATPVATTPSPAATDDKIVTDAVNDLMSSASPQPSLVPTPATPAAPAVASTPVAPSSTPVVPTETTSVSPNGDNNASTRKKVISPITDVSTKPDLNTLLAAEEAKSGQTTVAPQGEIPSQQPTVNTQTQPGNILMPTQPQATPSNTGIDPNSIAL